MDGPPTPPPLPAYTEEVLETLTPWLEAAERGLPLDEIRARLQEAGFEPATVEAALDQLLERGYLYEVNGTVRLTDDSP